MFMSQKMTYAEKREMRKRSKRTQAHERQNRQDVQKLIPTVMGK